MKKLILLLFFGMFLLNVISADTQSLTMRFIVPSEEPTPPEFNNLRNFQHYKDDSFSQSITATSSVGISCYYLNDTSTFDVDCDGLITNVTFICIGTNAIIDFESVVTSSLAEFIKL
jgi:hypothetical protein